MSIKYDSTTLKKITYNGVEVKKVIYNNIEVYSSNPLSFDPSNLSQYTLEQVIEIADNNLRSTYANTILGKTVTSLQNSYDSSMRAIIVHVDSNDIYMMTTTGSFGGGYWHLRITTESSYFYDGFNISIKSKIKSYFTPSYDQLNGGWSFMNSNKRRQFGFRYWTDTLKPNYTDRAWFVNMDGSFGAANLYTVCNWVAGFTV